MRRNTAWQETRILVAEWLLGLALRVAPPGTEDGRRLAILAEVYVKRKWGREE